MHILRSSKVRVPQNGARYMRRTASLLGLGLFALGTQAARADIIPNEQSITPSVNGFTWTYNAAVTNDETLQTNNFFTIYDFNGYVAGTNFQPANWTFSSALVGKTPSNTTPTDNPKIPNLTWTYSGPTLGPGPLDLGLFGADSTTANYKVGFFGAEGTKYAPGKPGDGLPVDNVGFTGVPAGTIPESSSILMLLPGLAPLGMVLRRRIAKK